MEFLVEFEVNVPEGARESEVKERNEAEAVAAVRLADAGHLLRVWRHRGDAGTTVIGLYRADTRAQLDGLLHALPLHEWMKIAVTALEPHPNDPAPDQALPAGGIRLPQPRLRMIYRLEATLAPVMELGDVPGGHRRIAPLGGGTFAGPELNGTVLPGGSADWQLVLPDGTVLGDIRHTLQTDRGDLLYVRSRGVRHGTPEVLARLARGEEVDPSEYTFRTSTQIETAAPDLDWLNKGVFVSVGGRRPGGVIYETYLVA
jgi:muconolactone delta-isomerase